MNILLLRSNWASVSKLTHIKFILIFPHILPNTISTYHVQISVVKYISFAKKLFKTFLNILFLFI